MNIALLVVQLDLLSNFLNAIFSEYGTVQIIILLLQVKKKKASHAGMYDIARTANRPMIHIGG